MAAAPTKSGCHAILVVPHSKEHARACLTDHPELVEKFTTTGALYELDVGPSPRKLNLFQIPVRIRVAEGIFSMLTFVVHDVQSGRYLAFRKFTQFKKFFEANHMALFSTPTTESKNIIEITTMSFVRTKTHALLRRLEGANNSALQFKVFGLESLSPFCKLADFKAPSIPELPEDREETRSSPTPTETSPTN